MRWMILLGFLGLTSLSMWSQEPRMDFLLERLRDKGESDYVMIFSHRGDWRNAPENSLLAFQRCIDPGIDGIEVDVQKTKDGELVVMQDRTLERTTNGTGQVEEYTLEELQEFKLKNGLGRVVAMRIPTLREVFRISKEKVLLQIDKWPALKDDIIQLAREEGVLEQRF